MASTRDGLESFFPAAVRKKYEILSYRNAAQILSTSLTAEHKDLMDALSAFSLTIADIRKPGGNESDIPKRIAEFLQPKGWLETRIKGDLHIARQIGKPAKALPEDDDVDVTEQMDAAPAPATPPIIRRNYLDGHKVDFVKGRVAFDVEWNSKDQTFDRDLYAFRAFYECDLIDVAVILTRSGDLNEVFTKLGAELDAEGKPRLEKGGRPKMIRTKYGASTTWMGKLEYRLEAGRQGGCPVLAVGITRRVITDWKE